MEAAYFGLFKVCLHVTSPSPIQSPSKSPSKLNIVNDEVHFDGEKSNKQTKGATHSPQEVSLFETFVDFQFSVELDIHQSRDPRA